MRLRNYQPILLSLPFSTQQSEWSFGSVNYASPGNPSVASHCSRVKTKLHPWPRIPSTSALHSCSFFLAEPEIDGLIPVPGGPVQLGYHKAWLTWLESQMDTPVLPAISAGLGEGVPQTQPPPLIFRDLEGALESKLFANETETHFHNVFLHL